MRGLLRGLCLCFVLFGIAACTSSGEREIEPSMPVHGEALETRLPTSPGSSSDHMPSLPPGVVLAGPEGCCDKDGVCDGASIYETVEVCYPDVMGTEEVIAIMADNRVTRDEYETAFRNFATCMEKEGRALVEVDMGAEVITYSYPVVGTINDRTCYYLHFRSVDIFWQSYEAAGPSPERETRIKHYIQCLRDADVEPAVAELPTLPRDQALADDLLRKQARLTANLTVDQWDYCVSVELS